jgi:hypothetical protein
MVGERRHTRQLEEHSVKLACSCFKCYRQVVSRNSDEVGCFVMWIHVILLNFFFVVCSPLASSQVILVH